MKLLAAVFASLSLALLTSAQFENVTDFDSIDKNRDNQISFAEFQKWLDATHHNFGDAQQIFQNYDSNSDGHISINEFVPLAFKINQRPDIENDIFKRFDLDKNGVLTRKEMENADNTLGPEIIEGLFLVADNNLDGKITYEEFKQISTAFGQQTEKHSQNIGIARSLLEAIDANRDHRLSQQEVYSFVNQFNKVNEQTVAAAFYQLDMNNDGFVDLNELQVSPEKITALAGFQKLPSI